VEIAPEADEPRLTLRQESVEILYHINLWHVSFAFPMPRKVLGVLVLC
jgi:hypothetical protein